MIERQAERCEYLAFEQFGAFPEVTHAIFTRHGGYSEPPYAGLNLAISTGDDPERVRQNRAVVTRVIGLPLVAARPVHGAACVAVHRDEVDALRRAEPAIWADRLREWLRTVAADAMITDAPGVALLWAMADCAPVLLYDPRHQAIALIHAGWRGTARAIAPRTVAAMRAAFATRVEDVYAAIGPAIGACCYEVDSAVRAAFRAEPLAEPHACFVVRAAADGDHLFLDIARSNEGQLRAAGIRGDHLASAGICTGCRTDLFYSHRREPKPSGRFGAAIGLRARADEPH